MDMLIKDSENEFMQGMEKNGKIVQCYNTSNNPYYDSDYMLVVAHDFKAPVSAMNFAYFADIDDLFYFYDLI